MTKQIAIDGPAGAGKSTIAKRVAANLGYLYVDTGAMYRAMGLFFLDQGVDPDDEEAINGAVPAADVDIRMEDGEQHVYVNGTDITGRLRTEEAGMMASKTSAYATVRKKLVSLQQQIASRANVVMDGRDIGTAVLPDAPCKIYLTASAEKRAERRYLELQEKGETPSYDTILADIMKRDEQDMNRKISPLRQAEDAVLVDSSDMTIEEVTERIICESKS